MFFEVDRSRLLELFWPLIYTAARAPFVTLCLADFQALKTGKRRSTPPICTAVRLLFVPQCTSHLYWQYSWEDTSGRGFRKIPDSWPKVWPKTKSTVMVQLEEHCWSLEICELPGQLQESFGPEVSRECPRSVRDTFLTLRRHSRDTFGHSGARCPKDLEDTPWDTPSDTPVFGDTPRTLPGTFRARRAQKTPVAGRGVRNSRSTPLKTVTSLN